MKRLLLLSMMAGITLSAGFAESAQPRALVILEPEALAADATTLDVTLQRLSSSFTLAGPESWASLVQREPRCSRTNDLAVVRSLDAALIEGLRLFYDVTDIEASIRLLEPAIATILDSPCVMCASSQGIPRFPEAAITLLRLYLMKGRLTEASRLTRTAWAWIEDALHPNAPPEVLRFVDGVRSSMPPASAPLRVAIHPPHLAAGVDMAVDGRVIPGRAPWNLSLAPGSHQLALFTPGGEAFVRRVSLPIPGEIEIDLSVATRLNAGPAATGRFDGVDGAEAMRLAARVSSSIGHSVMLVRAARHRRGLEVIEIDPQGVSHLRFRATPEEGSAHEILLGEREIDAKASVWPWPWVAAGVSAGALSAAIALNVAANEDTASINAGVNRVDRRSREKTAAIACYAISGAFAAGAVLFAVLRPDPAARIIVLPDANGSLTLAVEAPL